MYKFVQYHVVQPRSRSRYGSARKIVQKVSSVCQSQTEQELLKPHFPEGGRRIGKDTKKTERKREESAAGEVVRWPYRRHIPGAREAPSVRGQPGRAGVPTGVSASVVRGRVGRQRVSARPPTLRRARRRAAHTESTTQAESPARLAAKKEARSEAQTEADRVTENHTPRDAKP